MRTAGSVGSGVSASAAATTREATRQTSRRNNAKSRRRNEGTMGYLQYSEGDRRTTIQVIVVLYREKSCPSVAREGRIRLARLVILGAMEYLVPIRHHITVPPGLLGTIESGVCSVNEFFFAGHEIGRASCRA